MTFNMKTHVISILVMISIVLSVLVTIAPAVYAEYDVPSGYVQTAETDSLILYYNSELNGISVLNKSNGYIWSSIVDKEKYELKDITPIQKSNIDSLFAIIYTDIKSNEGKLNKVYTAFEKKNVTTKNIKNGLAINYFFTFLNMNIVLEITLENDCLVMRFPSEKITEKGRNLLMSLELLPCFGASNHSDDGYILYPDGCGGLLRYEKYNERPNNLTTLSWNVYGPDPVSIEDYYSAMGDSSLTSSNAKHEASLPLFGVKKGENGYLAYITEGAADSRINVSPEGHIVPLNRAAFEFKYRNTFDIILSNISAGKDTSSIKKGVKVDKVLNRQDFEAKYKFLTGENSSYSGMANAYRKQLISSGKLKKSVSKTIPLGLDLFCGITEKRLLFDKYISMTSFKEAEEIIQEFLDEDVTALQVTIKGWASKGYGRFPVNMPPEKKLGGKKGFTKLVSFAKTNNVELFSQSSTVLATADNNAFSTRSDVVFKGNNLQFSDNLNYYYLLNTNAVSKKINDLIRKLFDFGNPNVSLASIGKYVYQDYSAGKYQSRVTTTQKWSELLQTVNMNGKKLAVEGGNEYVLQYADRLYNVPIETSRTNISDEDVPFYQMIVHGYIPYSSNAGNMFYDSSIQKLKWIEYGCIPYYELTFKHSNELKYTSYNGLYSSYYKYWIETAVDTYKEFNGNLAGLWDVNMTKHSRISNKLVVVEYSNNKKVYINYDNKEITFEGITIPAKSYIVD